MLFLEKLSLITNEECPESNIIPVEAMKFLQEEAPMESVHTGPTGNEQDGEDEDLVSEHAYSDSSMVFVFFSIYFSLILFKSTTSKSKTTTTPTRIDQL